MAWCRLATRVNPCQTRNGDAELVFATRETERVIMAVVCIVRRWGRNERVLIQYLLIVFREGFSVQ